MKKYLLIFATLAAAVLAGSCKKEVIPDKITLSTGSTIQAAWEEKNYDLVFTSNAEWTASVTEGSSFISIDKTSGAAGTATVKVSVQTNSANASRSGQITIKAGTASETVTVTQEAVGETSESAEVSVNYMAQEIEFPVSAQPDKVTSSVDWISPGAMGTSSVKLAVARNDGASVREGTVSIVIVKHTIYLTVKQDPESGEMSEPKVTYLGNKEFIYDQEEGYTTFGQYLLKFATQYGSVELVLNSNPAEGEIDPATVPAGTYGPDAAANFADKTFSLIGSNVTKFTQGGVDVPVIDGEVVVSGQSDNYSVTASLLDDTQRIHVFTYNGPLGAVAKDNFGANAYSVPSYSNYYTYYAGNNFIWNITLVFSSDPSGSTEDHISYVDFQVVTDSGAAGSGLPTGTFTYKDIDFYSANTGYLETTPGTFKMSGNTIGQNAFKLNSAPTLTITKEEDGRYTFAVTSNVTTQAYVLDAEGYWTYDQNGNPIMNDLATYDWNPVVTLAVPDAQPGMMATPDADIVTFDENSNAGQYVGYWYSDIYGQGYNAFAFGWNNKLNSAYTVFITVNSDKEYVYEKNFNNRFCKTPVPDGTYSFSNEAVANTLLPTARCYVMNDYTGSTFRINGGSITISGGTITFNDVTGKVTATGATCTFKGSFSTGCMYLQDYSDHTKRKLDIVPVQ